jgi:hypothetical protein
MHVYTKYWKDSNCHMFEDRASGPAEFERPSVGKFSGRNTRQTRTTISMLYFNSSSRDGSGVAIATDASFDIVFPRVRYGSILFIESLWSGVVTVAHLNLF